MLCFKFVLNLYSAHPSGSTGIGINGDHSTYAHKDLKGKIFPEEAGVIKQANQLGY